jgi:chemotaxis protein MotB
MSRRNKRLRGHVNHERWLVSYADFITLLFAFFVVLYASAQVDHRKVGRLAVAIQAAFEVMGVFPDAAASLPFDMREALPFDPDQIRQMAKRKNAAQPESPDAASAAESADMTTLQKELQEALHHEIAIKAIALHREREGLVLSLREFGFFDSGSATIKASGLPALDRIASVLAVRTCGLRFEGHTDNVPIHTPQMASNWELSSNRATELVRLLITRYGFAPERLSAAGYAQYHPVAPNATVQGRAQNRRVDLVILSESVLQIDANAITKPSAGIDTNHP